MAVCNGPTNTDCLQNVLPCVIIFLDSVQVYYFALFTRTRKQCHSSPAKGYGMFDDLLAERYTGEESHIDHGDQHQVPDTLSGGTINPGLLQLTNCLIQTPHTEEMLNDCGSRNLGVTNMHFEFPVTDDSQAGDKPISESQVESYCEASNSSNSSEKIIDSTSPKCLSLSPLSPANLSMDSSFSETHSSTVRLQPVQRLRLTYRAAEQSMAQEQNIQSQKARKRHTNRKSRNLIDKKYPARELLDVRIKDNRLQYLVKWAPSWEPAKNINTPLLEEWWVPRAGENYRAMDLVKWVKKNRTKGFR